MNSKPEITLKTPFPAVPFPKLFTACIAAALIPGAGHFVLGRVGRGALFLVCIYGMVALGLLMKGHLYTWSDMDRLSHLYFLSDVGIGLLYPVLYIFNVGRELLPGQPLFEHANNFLAVAGLLNYLIIFDAFDIGMGRKA
jgi:hypothetical protein